MSDKYKDNIDDELEEEKTDGSLKYEENDNWEFEATAHTLENTVVENDEFEIILPPSASDDAAAKESADESEPEEKEETKKNDSSKYETRERPSAKDTKNDDADKPAKTTATGKSNRMKFICGALISLIVI